MVEQMSLFEDTGREVAAIPVHISYEIIRLFSEGLYKSPNKAIEELVTNSYDAYAERVHILLPDVDQNGVGPEQPLWVIDDGHGMDEEGFHDLWRIAESKKVNQVESNGRPVIGQFGIGKLASYVLAWKLSHISCIRGHYLLTSMNFREVEGLGLGASIFISLREVDETIAQERLLEIKSRDPEAWEFMFGDGRGSSWTAAALSDFKDLYHRLQAGTLRWVLSTGLPLHSNFQIRLNGRKLVSSKENWTPLKTFNIQETLPDIGPISGTASIYEKSLTGGKSDQSGRSNGFFIRVRGRVINLEDEYFGIEPVNHAAWARFALEVDADGLRDHLLSSREGVRDSDVIRQFREELRRVFNKCRNEFQSWRDQQGMDVKHLLDDSPQSHVYDPLVLSVQRTIQTGSESFYIDRPRDTGSISETEWLESFGESVRGNPFEEIRFSSFGQNAPALRYEPSNRNLIVNSDHPFIDKLGGARGRDKGTPAKIFASSEALLEGQLAEHGIDPAVTASLLDDRDRVLRLVAGDATPTAQEVIRRLHNATHNSTALERATGSVFQLLGFDYERKGGNKSGPDGVLYARLGRHDEGSANYILVYDAKQTNSPAVPADKVNLGSLENFRTEWRANYGFFIAEKYQGECDALGKLNSQLQEQQDNFGRLTLLKVGHLELLVKLHYKHGVTLTELGSLFESACTVSEVNVWLKELEERLIKQGEIPLQVLLHGLEAAKDDILAKPNIAVVRKSSGLEEFPPERLTARLKAVESIIGNRWIEIDEDSYEVTMHHTDIEILRELERNINALSRTFDFGS